MLRYRARHGTGGRCDDQPESAVEFCELPEAAVAGVPGPGSQVFLKLLKAGTDLRLAEEPEG